MNALLSFSISLILFSIASVQFASSASFPNPPPFPAPNASADDWALFWKLLHNYYAIIARPRFGKRHDSLSSQPEDPSVLTMTNPDSVSSSFSSSSEHGSNYMLRENSQDDDIQQNKLNKLYRFINRDRRRRR